MRFSIAIRVGSKIIADVKKLYCHIILRLPIVPFVHFHSM